MPEIENIVIVSADSLREKDIKNMSDADLFLEDEMNRPGDYYANASWTVPAHASIFSGKLPSEHGTTTENMYFDDDNYLVNYFKSAGYNCSLVSENNLLTSGLGFSRAFNNSIETTRKSGEVWNDKSWRSHERFHERWIDFLTTSFVNRDFNSLSSFASTAIEKIGIYDFGEDYNPTHSIATLDRINCIVESEAKDFIFVNLMATHTDYTFNDRQKKEFLDGFGRQEILDITSTTDLHESLEEKGEGLNDNEIEILKNSYRASISYLDSLLRKLYRSLPENSLLVLVGDHGEVIGEHPYQDQKFVEHHFGTYEELVEVPFRYKFKGDIDKEIDFEVADHSSFVELIKNLMDDKESDFSYPVISEYYGKYSIASYFGEEYPDEFSELYERESFSVISEEFKLDIASDGVKLWERGDYEQEEVDNPEKVDELKSEIPFVLRTVLEDRDLI